ncbi:uncharacterized protein LOC143510803 isoform X2 [Brachyhypopomus gauderio]|uniref:uncharacterized protein LOC143510803 isoform X2 n=1 Tax=Brachyhypopomus gauderio TaxID=698409 RepID=UPI004042829A
MENYEEFCSRRLDGLGEETRCATRSNQQRALSAIQFHGKHVLLPKLSENQRLEMAEQRQKAMEIERERHTVRSSSVLVRVQDIITHIQLQNNRDVEQDADSSPLVTQAPPSRRAHPQRQPSGLMPCSSAWRKDTLRLLNSRMERTGKRSEELGEERTMMTQTNKEREETPSCKGNTKGSVPECPLVGESGTPFTSADFSCSVDSQSPGSVLASLSPSASLMGSYAQLPSPQPSSSPPAQRQRRLNPVSSAHILISVPVTESELCPHALDGTDATKSEPHPSEGPSNRITVLEDHSDPSECLTAPTSGGEWNYSCSELHGNRLTSVSTSTPRSAASVTPRPVTVPHTAPPTQPGPALQREKNRQHNSAPYQRSPPAPLNQSYDVESPSPSLLRPQVSSGLESFTLFVQRKQDLAGWSQHPLEDRMTLGSPTDADTTQDKALGEKIQVLEALNQQLDTHHHTHLLKEQEKETLNLLQGSLCRLTAVARGFLTRRLLQTEKIKHLRKTIQDSRELISSFQSDAQQRRASFTTQDLSLQRRLRAQLRTALCDVHEIFFVWPVTDKLILLQHNRLLHKEKPQSPQDTRSLSSATQKSLDRRRRRQSKTIPLKSKTPPQRTLQPAQGQTAVISSQRFKTARVVRMPVESFRSRLSLG